MSQEELAQKAKFASGCFWVLFFGLSGPLAAWDKESGEIYKVKTDLKLAMIMLVLNDKQKPVSSREGMKRCMETSTNFKEWIEESRQDYKDMLGYLAGNDFEHVGQLTERNALAMHATTRTATPAFSYLTEESHKAMDFVRELRAAGHACYFTMDAGPNVKVLCLEEDLDQLVPLFDEFAIGPSYLRQRTLKMKTKYQVQTGGKLYLAGEYAVLTPGYGAVIQFIPIYLSATIQESSIYQLASDLFGYQVDLTPNKDYALIQETIQLMEKWLKDQGIAPKPFDLHLRGTLGEERKKYGIGSSGSVVLLVIKAMAALYELDLHPDLLFRLAAVVLVQRGDNGSMGDLACIAYEDLIYYQSFDRTWLHEVLNSQPLSQVLDLDWDYQICSIQPAVAYNFLVGWTKEPAISSDLTRQVKGAIKEEFLQESQSAVKNLEKGLREGNQKEIETSIKRADKNLKSLNPLIYTPALKVLQEATEVFLPVPNLVVLEEATVESPLVLTQLRLRP